MKIDLLTQAPADAVFLLAGGRARVVLRRDYALGAGGALIPGQSALVWDSPPGGPEGDAALEKPLVDLVVEGFVDDPLQGGSVTIGGALWLSRGALAQGNDVGAHLFGWQGPGEAPREGEPFPQHQSVTRRTIGFTRHHSGPLPAGALVTVEQDGGNTWSVTLPTALGLKARHFSYCGHGPDLPRRWNPSSPFALAPDTLILRPDQGTVTILWRGGWPWGALPPELYRSLQIADAGGFS